MKKYILLLLMMLPSVVAAQNILWKDYYSYREITAVFASDQQVFAATKNAVFVLDNQGELVASYNTTDNLKISDISQIYYSAAHQKIILGSQNGNIALIDMPNQKITHLNDIANKTTLSAAQKKIYDLEVQNNTLYVATGFGIAEVLIDLELFGDSYFFEADGMPAEVLNMAIIGDDFYANTNNVGIRKIGLDEEMINDSNWETINFENWLSIVNFNNQLVGVKDDLTLNVFVDNAYQQVGDVYGGFLSLNVNGNVMTALTREVARAYSPDFSWTSEYVIATEQSQLTSATTMGDYIYCGSQKDGLYTVQRSDIQQTNDLTPDGPLSNRVFALKVDSNNHLWTVFGGYNDEYNPYLLDIGLSEYGINRLDLSSSEWQSIPYQTFTPFRATSYIEEHPISKDIYISSFHDGLMKITPNGDDFANSDFTIYNHENTGSGGLEAHEQTAGDPSSITVRVNGPAFEADGKAWITNGYSDRPLKTFTGNQWQSYNIINLIDNPGNTAYNAPLIDKNGVKWVGTFLSGAFAFDESPQKLINISNLPGQVVRTMAIDYRNQVWIGTNRGLRVVPSVDNFNNNSLASQSIIILEDGLAQELFFQQNILKIKVDGSNNKWVAIAGAGVFLVSADGQETIYHFDQSNSPLPSDDIVDIAIDDETGEVFFATNEGLVSYQHYATAPKDDLSEVYFFPNPVKPEFEGEVKISGLMQNANIKITDIAGNLVFETTATGGSALWNTRNFAGKKVASGVYVVFVSSDEGSEKSVGKIMVIR